MDIRRATPDDRDTLYDICLRTGDAGEDATPLYRFPELIGALWVGPYLALQPTLAFVAEDDDDVVGYVLGAEDTREFEMACEQRWWPALRARYPEPIGTDASSADAALIRRIHHPPAASVDVVADFPAHLHIDILPRGQGRGVGRRLIVTLLDALRQRGVRGVHLGVNARNTRAIGFYEHLGFAAVGAGGEASEALLLGLRLS